MTSDRQRHANKSNARRSTGPKTASGRATSSANARKHGLNSPPPWDDVTRYYRIILDDASARPYTMSGEVRAQAALALAEAEAQLARCVNVERTTLIQLVDRSDNGISLGSKEAEMTIDPAAANLAVLKRLLAKAHDPGELRMLEQLTRLDPDGPTQLHRRLRTLRRYRREAEARRRKALKQWLMVVSEQGGSAMATTAAAG